MILYHGSSVEVIKPDLVHSRTKLDFGRGFYVTPLYIQAAKWCRRFERYGERGIVSIYNFDDAKMEELSVLRFDVYSEDWLDFVLMCRSGKDTSNHDIVIGSVADDKVFNTLELFFDGLIDSAEAIKRLRYEKPTLQLCFKTEKALSLLHFDGSDRV